MSYLPRMSKTYKEPTQITEEDEADKNSDISRSCSLMQPASSLVNDKTFNPQTALKHYKYLPHPPPVLPGPSIADEANENELFREASRIKRSLSRINEISSSCLSVVSDNTAQISSSSVDEDEVSSNTCSTKKKCPIKGSKVSIHKKKYGKVNTDRKKEHRKKEDNVVNLCILGTDIAESFAAAQAAQNSIRNNNERSENPERSDIRDGRLKNPVVPVVYAGTSKSIRKIPNDVLQTNVIDDNVTEKKEIGHRNVQCSIFGKVDKTFVMPSIINCLLKALAFLLHEINKEELLCCSSNDGKRIMTQVQLILADLCNHSVEKNLSFDITYSDSKRMEKVFEDLQKYVKDTYGDMGEYIDKAESLKKIFLQLKLKELELGILSDKVQEAGSLYSTDVDIKGSEYRNPEITLQNRRLESEQLLAEVEFSGIELKKYQKALAEADWDLKLAQEQISNFKKFGSKSKIEVLSRKPSIQKFGETSGKHNKCKESSEVAFKKKT